MVRSGQNSNLSEILCMSSLPASIKRIGSKTTKKRWRHHFLHYKSMGAFCCHGNQFWSNLPQNLMQPFPYPNDATHKIWSRLVNWLQRYSSSKVWNFRHSRASNSKNEWSDSAPNWTRLSFYACPKLCMSLLPASINRIRSKATKKPEDHWSCIAHLIA